MRQSKLYYDTRTQSTSSISCITKYSQSDSISSEHYRYQNDHLTKFAWSDQLFYRCSLFSSGRPVQQPILACSSVPLPPGQCSRVRTQPAHGRTASAAAVMPVPTDPTLRCKPPAHSPTATWPLPTASHGARTGVGLAVTRAPPSVAAEDPTTVPRHGI